MAEEPPKPKKLTQIIGAIAATMGGLTLGTIIGWSSPAQDILIDGGVAPNQFPHISSIMCLGAATAQLYLFLTIDRLGRKWTMITVACPIIICYILMGLINNWIVFLVARFWLGFCGGAFCVAAPTYIGEYADKHIRGTLGVMFQLLLVIGIELSYVLGLANNRYVLCFPLAIPPIICAALMLFMPESPVLLIAQERYEEAMLALTFYRGEHFDLTEDISDIEEYLNCDEGSFSANIKTTASLIGGITLTIYCIFAMIAGVMPMIIHEDILFRSGIVYSMNKVACYIVGLLILIVGTIIAAYLIDTHGRRILLLISLGIMTCTIAVLGIYFLVLAYHELAAKKAEYIVMWVLYLYMLAYGLGAGPIIWCFVGEVPSPGAKNFIVAVAFSTFWIIGYVVMRVHSFVEDRIGEGGSLLIISGVTLTGFVFASLFVIETKNMTLYEIQVLLKQGHVAV